MNLKLKRFFKETPILRVIFPLLRVIYIYNVRSSKNFINKIYRFRDQKKGERVFCWNGFQIKEAWNDPYAASNMVNGLNQFIQMREMVESERPVHPIIFDVGAHIGTFAVAASSIDGATIYAFEPVKSTFDKLKWNVVTNEIYNIHVYSFGLSDCKSEIDIRTSEISDSGGFSVSRTNREIDERHREKSEITEFISLDEFCSIHQLKRVDFIKIRIQGEGHEAAVIAGAWATINRDKPHLLINFVPSDFNFQNHNADILVRLMDELNYLCFVYDSTVNTMTEIHSSFFQNLKDNFRYDLLFKDKLD